MSNLAGLPPMGQKPAKAKPNPKRLKRIRSMNCIICSEYGITQRYPTQAHHCRHGRHSQRRVSDDMTIPLCLAHHTGVPGTVSAEGSPAAFISLFGRDFDWLDKVNDILAGEINDG